MQRTSPWAGGLFPRSPLLRLPIFKQRDESRRREGDQARPASTTVHLISLYHAPLPVCLQLPHQHFQRRAKSGFPLEEKGGCEARPDGEGVDKDIQETVAAIMPEVWRFPPHSD